MTETLVSDLIAIIRQTPGDPGPRLRARLESESNRGPFEGRWASESVLAELGELARRARAFDATDDEIALSLGVLFSTSSAPTVAP